MGKKMGRPVIGNPLTTEIKVRVDDETAKKLELLCAEKSITKSQAIRNILSAYFSKK